MVPMRPTLPTGHRSLRKPAPIHILPPSQREPGAAGGSPLGAWRPPQISLPHSAPVLLTLPAPTSDITSSGQPALSPESPRAPPLDQSLHLKGRLFMLSNEAVPAAEHLARCGASTCPLTWWPLSAPEGGNQRASNRHQCRALKRVAWAPVALPALLEMALSPPDVN